MSDARLPALHSALTSPRPGAQSPVRDAYAASKRALLKRRVLSLSAYVEELRREPWTREEKLDRFGSPTAPIPIPLRPGETVNEYGRRFWICLETRHISREKLCSEASAERAMRIEFARENADEYERGHQNKAHRSVDSLYVTKIVELAAHQRETRAGKFTKLGSLSRAERIELFGSPVIPIFIPLARGETAEMYEERFVEWLARERRTTLEDLRQGDDETQERYEHIQFSVTNTKGSERFVPRESTSNRKRERGRDCREELDEVHSRKRLEHETANDSSDLQVSKEYTNDTVEETVNKVARQPEIKLLEPQASLSAKDAKEQSGTLGNAAIVPPSPLPLRVCRCSAEPASDSSVMAVVSAFVACGCQKCLMNGLLHVAKNIPNRQDTTASNTVASPQVGRLVDLTTDDDEDDASTKPPRPLRRAAAITEVVLSDALTIDELAHIPLSQHVPVQLNDDPVERQLIDAYNAINDPLAEQESKTETGADEIARSPVSNLCTAVRLHDEHINFEAAIASEAEKRSAALARIVIYVWRNNQRDLERMLHCPEASHVVYVQQASHRLCASLAVSIRDQRSRIMKLKNQLDTIVASDYNTTSDRASESNRLAMLSRVGSLLTTAERDLRSLFAQQRREFETIVRFDERVRLVAKQLLAKASE